jgi:hypothetical protein
MEQLKQCWVSVLYRCAYFRSHIFGHYELERLIGYVNRPGYVQVEAFHHHVHHMLEAHLGELRNHLFIDLGYALFTEI